jgi:hypothetical protein
MMGSVMGGLWQSDWLERDIFRLWGGIVLKFDGIYLPSGGLFNPSHYCLLIRGDKTLNLKPKQKKPFWMSILKDPQFWVPFVILVVGLIFLFAQH